MKKTKKTRDLLICADFQTIIKIHLFYYCEKVFTYMNTWRIGENLMKHYYRRKNFYSHLNMKDNTDADNTHAKRVCADFVINKLSE